MTRYNTITDLPERYREQIEPKQNPVEDNPAEHIEQRAVVRWLEIHGICFIHVPNEGKRKKSTGAMLVGQGMKKGAPDLIIFDAPPEFPGRIGTAIEMKRRRGGRVSEEQSEWLDSLHERRWLTGVCKGADDALEFLRMAGYGKKEV